MGEIAYSQPPVQRRSAAALDERRLIREAKAGDASAVEELMRAFWPRAYAAAAAMVGHGPAAEDVAQEAMLKAIRGVAGFDESRPFAPWLTRIATNVALDHLRSERRRPRPVEQSVEAAAQGDPADLLELTEALSRLKPRARAMVVLLHLGGFSSEEIATQMDSTAATVRSTISRALAGLRREEQDDA